MNRHLECVSDFNGNDWAGKPGAWADLWERPDGSRVITLGGGWEFYAPGAPGEIPDTSPHFKPFLAACETGDDFGYARRHWPTVGNPTP